MPKTTTGSTVQLPHDPRPFETNARPDPFDERDLPYRARLQVLPAAIDQRNRRRYVYHQTGQSCTGHALAGVVNHVLKVTTASRRVSPYQLYQLARRYDEFPGELDAGSSLRAAFKGWFNHGVGLESTWPELDSPELDPTDEVNVRAWRERPLGAFYRVNPYRLDDVQSAISELTAIAVSSTIHDGWLNPILVKRTRVRRGEEAEMFVIAKSSSPVPKGGHAYCLVGYNEVGFLVQNSWGKEWGKGGFATLPYEDWLDSAYDAWVARPGVPQTPLISGRTRTIRTAGGALSTRPGPDLRRLAFHVVNTGNDGQLSTTGTFTSSPEQLDRMVDHMGRWHDFLLKNQMAEKRHILIWSHGGGTSESGGLDLASRNVNWWLNCGIYPITTVWETGGLETISDSIQDLFRGTLPTGFGFNFEEGLDRLVEGLCRRRARWSWREMKDNGRKASGPAPAGATLLLERLATYVKTVGAGNVAIHLAAHSAGSVYQAAMLERMEALGLKVDTMTWLGPAITVEEFNRVVVPRLGPGKTVKRFTCFDLGNTLELNDAVAPFYHKSAVYLVARGMEDSLGQSVNEVPVLGLEKWWKEPISGGTGEPLKDVVAALNGQLVVSPNGAPFDSRTDARTHGGLDGDGLTMTSVAMRALGRNDDSTKYLYQPNAPLLHPEDAPWGPTGARAGTGAAVVSPQDEPILTGAPESAGEELQSHPAEMVEVGGEMPMVAAAPPPPTPAIAPRQKTGLSPEIGVAPRTGSPILDVLAATGWKVPDTDKRRGG
ncbi:MAG: C1 family peptidase [Sporichthyaceae bacterium]